MKIGDLRHRVTLQHKTYTKGSYGDMVETWNDGDTVWADIRPLRGNEFYNAQQISSKLDTKITVRYRTDITTKHRIKYGARHFKIVAIIDPQMKHRELQLMCEEVLTSK